MVTLSLSTESDNVHYSLKPCSLNWSYFETMLGKNKTMSLFFPSVHNMHSKCTKIKAHLPFFGAWMFWCTWKVKQYMWKEHARSMCFEKIKPNV